MTLGYPRNHGCRISDAWTFNGLQTLIIENELLRVTVLAGKGSDIVEFRYKPFDLDFLYSAPGGIRNPTREPLSAPSGGPFLDYFSGGWNEVLPNGGPPVTYKGAELGQHGEISLLPWEYAILEDSPAQVAVKLWVRPLRTPFFLEKTLSMVPGRAALFIDERLVNEGGEPLHFMWGHHIAFGRPFLEEGAVIDVPARRFIVHEAMAGFEPRRFQPEADGPWPQTNAPDGSPVDASVVPAYGMQEALEMAYATELTDGWYAMTNQVKQIGFGIHFDPTVFGYLWYWQQLGDVARGYPWWGRTHTAALEPWTSYPTNGLNEAIDNGSARSLQPGEALETKLVAVAYAGVKRVGAVRASGEVVEAE
jgi:galactose mutarotase-like enzyme